jgi:hypothetical protein
VRTSERLLLIKIKSSNRKIPDVFDNQERFRVNQLVRLVYQSINMVYGDKVWRVWGEGMLQRNIGGV